jgi:hypothetical protein
MVSVFSSFYAGNLMYYRSLLKAKNPTIDLLENFNKQSYRNRCVIASPNGSLSLVIPVIRKSKNRFKDVKIDASQNWKKVHWKSLESAYRSSPYFEFYEDSFRSIYFDNNCDFLFEFNQLIHENILKVLKTNYQIKHSTSYVEDVNRVRDFRLLIHPKMNYPKYIDDLKYDQVFQEKNNFIPNLSILDLIFNEGPRARQLLGL